MLSLSGATISKFRRAFAGQAFGNYHQRILEYYADLNWSNASDEDHWIEIAVTCEIDNTQIGNNTGPTTVTRTFTRPKDSTSATRILLTRWKALPSGINLSRSYTITITATNGVSSSTPLTITDDATLSDTVTTFVPPRYTNLGEIILPAVAAGSPAPNTMAQCNQLAPEAREAMIDGADSFVLYDVTPTVDQDSGLKESGALVIRPLPGTPLFGTTDAPKKVLIIHGIDPWNTVKLTRNLLSTMLRDGGEYTVSLYWPKPKVLTAAVATNQYPIWGRTFGDVATFIEYRMTFEYWKNGPQNPTINSALFVNIPVGKPFRYDILATGGTLTYASPDFASITGINGAEVDTDTGVLTASSFSTAGVYTCDIEATNDAGTTTATLTITVEAFTADDKTEVAILNQSQTIPLTSSHEATWALTTGTLPQGMQLFQGLGGIPARISGIPTAEGTSTFVLTATKKGAADTATANITINVLAGDDDETVPITEIVVPSNASIYSSDEPLVVGEQLVIGLISKPAVAKWSAQGLPSGVVIDEDTGLVSGTLTTAGRFSAVITAKAANHRTSLPVLLVASVDPAPVVDGKLSNSGTALQRIPWLADEWKIIDLQVDARGRSVSSTLATDAGILIKAGDDLNFAVFFINALNKPFNLPCSRLRLTLREANNLGEPLIYESDESPAVVDTYPDVFYSLVSAQNGSGRAEMRDTVEAWLELSSRNKSATDTVVRLPCVADVEWEVDNQLFSSQSFPVMVELDVTR